MARVWGVLHEKMKSRVRNEVVLDTISVSQIKELSSLSPWGRPQVELRIIGRDGSWFRVRPSGRLRLWKRDPHRVELPVKYGMYESITLTSSDFDNGKVALLA